MPGELPDAFAVLLESKRFVNKPEVDAPLAELDEAAAEEVLLAFVLLAMLGLPWFTDMLKAAIAALIAEKSSSSSLGSGRGIAGCSERGIPSIFSRKLIRSSLVTEVLFLR